MIKNNLIYIYYSSNIEIKKLHRMRANYKSYLEAKILVIFGEEK